MLRQRLSQKYESTPLSSRRSNLKTEKPVLSEWRLALVGLVLSLTVIVTKIYSAHHYDIKQFFVERRLFTFETVNDDGNVMYYHVWKNVVKFSKVWLPVVCGIFTTYFTWLMVYLDSDVPGVQPPSPLSPNKYKSRSGHSFHLNYVFALIMGISVAFYMYWRNINIEFS
ncbi:ADP-ribosylation factor-like protein 6-interacting protein 6 [Tribolium madens]|uniref:ADP-ribosylation factor-like protein 6-interacting protein 6 n=1 Tax=Tribolium madens TaxID=41895 RepID=UPI001CF75FC2|nr:ADP-ribosylation factor-like protein 6-interacting protein 6 [Tribolium madens]